MAPGQHRIEFEALEGWDRLPEGYAYVEVAGVACDSQDRVYVFNRGAYPMIVFDKEGRFLNAWGKGSSRTRTASSSIAMTTCGSPTTRTIRSTNSRPTASAS